MTKQTGMGNRLLIGGYDLSGDINSITNMSGGPAALDLTDITQEAPERAGGLRNGLMEVASYFNKAAGRAFPVLSALPRTDTHAMWQHRQTLGAPGIALVAKQINYDFNRTPEGNLLANFSLQSNLYGLEHGDLLTAGIRTDSSATNGSSLDGSAATAFGAQFYLQMLVVAGTSCTVTVEDSADNSSFTAVTGAAFSAVAAGSVSFQRLQTARDATIRRYLRVATSGTFSNAQFSVLAVRNQTLVSF